MKTTHQPSPTPQELRILISTLRTSFFSHHPRILDIYTLIQTISTLASKLDRINQQNAVLGAEIQQYGWESETQLKYMEQRVRVLGKEKDSIEKQMKKVKRLWDEAMNWIEREEVMHGMNEGKA